MRVSIRGQIKDLTVTTITLEQDPDNPINLVLLKCLVCGETLGQHQGRVMRVFPGAAPVSLPFIVQCRQCKRRYIITSIV